MAQKKDKSSQLLGKQLVGSKNSSLSSQMSFFFGSKIILKLIEHSFAQSMHIKLASPQIAQLGLFLNRKISSAAPP